MSVENNKNIVRRLYEEMFSNAMFFNEIFTPDYKAHHIGREINGLEEVTQFILSMRSNHPGVHFRIEDMFAEGDKVVVRYEIVGESRIGIAIHHMVNGKVAELWDVSGEMNS